MVTGTTAQQIVDVVTPAAGESVTEGTILEWHVKVGDSIAVDATIVEISTDKVDVELPSPVAGTVTELLVEEGDTVTVGQVIARIAVGDADSVSTVPSNGNGGAPEADANGGNRSGDGGSAVATADGGATGDDLASGKLVDVLTPAA
ncbi:MAG TPA: biotin/lipoyl-containing protein, partial [Solirubrobacteraceae bacterium]|nr:biotin/lipoyl-containing protein [Solirubrobacteraceae bacterium]